MRKINLFITAVITMVILFPGCGRSQNNVKLENTIDSVSYALGIDFAANALEGMVRSGQSYNNKLFVEGFKNYFDDEAKMNHEEAFEILSNFFDQLMNGQEYDDDYYGYEDDYLDSAPMETPSNEENMSYLEKHAQEKGVVKTQSGLQYKVIKEGKGAKPSATDKVRVHYTGKLTNGNVFDSSKNHGGPAEFGLNQVISGWTEGLQLMPVGSVFEFTIPPYLGYGNQEIPGLIPANSILVFEVELLDILK